jgi:hypothetical protein
MHWILLVDNFSSCDQIRSTITILKHKLGDYMMVLPLYHGRGSDGSSYIGTMVAKKGISVYRFRIIKYTRHKHNRRITKSALSFSPFP